MPELENSNNPLDLGNISNFPDLKNIVVIGDKVHKGMINFKDLSAIHTSKDEIELIEREKRIDFESATNIQFTSGTTGYPKGASLSHHNILNNAYFLGELFHIDHKDKIIIPVPLYHCFGMVIGNLVAINYGATMVYPSEGFDAKKTLESISEYGGTIIYGVPTMFIAMI